MVGKKYLIENPYGKLSVNSKKEQLQRRDFLKMAVIGASALAVPGIPAFAGPFSYDELKHLIPEDKMLSEAWIESLFERGNPEVFTAKNEELKHIGMPVGGIACGQLYLGGDGRLWLWHIFKTEYSREKDHGQRFSAMTLGGHYANPDKVFTRETRPVDQGTIIKVTSGDDTNTRTLDNNGFEDITFRGEYPIGKVKYKDKNFPIEVHLDAFSPFIPLNAKESSLPATIMSYSLKNKGSKLVKVEIAKWMENAVCPFIDDAAWGNRKNVLEFGNQRISVVGYIENDNKKGPSGELISEQHGFGSMALSLLNSKDMGKVALSIPLNTKPEELFAELNKPDEFEKEKFSSFNNTMIGAVGKEIELKPGETKTVDFCISWYFPYLNQQEKETGQLLALKDIHNLKRHYFNRFNNAGEVAAYLQTNYRYLTETTRNWNKTWYDSSLPYWLLDRSFISIDCLATNTVLWFNNDRFYGWEGVECCPGTCQHVWHYTQSMARVFPEIERYLREKIDYGLSFRDDGGMGHRDETAGNYGKTVAHDGHCGTIIRAYREHKMSANNEFLSRNYVNIKKSVQYIISEDKNRDGLLEGGQHNTLDASWYGPMGWISSLYIGALAAGKAMALEMGDNRFAAECDDLIKKGQENIVNELFNGEYFIHKPDPNHPNAINSNDGCHIDQVLGQSLAFQAGVPERIIPEKETISALKSIWKYNFAPDAFIYQEQHQPIKGVRIYATAGEAGTIMCTWPKGGDENAVPGMDKRQADSPTWLGPGGYFDECMNGFEYQVASHMINEGMLEEGLAITKSVHERYGAKKRNPYNEIECGDHYSRSMASYGVYNALCGFDHHGPKGILTFNPKVTPENFKAAFITAEGWGSYSQEMEDGKHNCTLELSYGKLILNQLNIHVQKESQVISVKINSKNHNEYEFNAVTGKLSLLMNSIILNNEEKLEVVVILV